jgi:hypothetical protein
VVECTALEMRHRCKPIGGSNPSLSAILFRAHALRSTVPLRCAARGCLSQRRQWRIAQSLPLPPLPLPLSFLRLVKRALPRPVPMVSTPQRSTSCM